jgi:FixJ family two-component response regulator
MLAPLAVVRYHIFLLVTNAHNRSEFRAEISAYCKDSMTQQPSAFVVAVVDDDQRILESLEDLLESADYAVRLFASATALIESGCLAEIDCLVSDLDMPVMDGLELLRAVRAARPALPIILITAHPDMLSRLPSTGLGNYRSFTKPLNGPELLMAISDDLRNPDLRAP